MTSIYLNFKNQNQTFVKPALQTETFQLFNELNNAKFKRTRIQMLNETAKTNELNLNFLPLALTHRPEKEITQHLYKCFSPKIVQKSLFFPLCFCLQFTHANLVTKTFFSFLFSSLLENTPGTKISSLPEKQDLRFLHAPLVQVLSCLYDYYFNIFPLNESQVRFSKLNFEKKEGLRVFSFLSLTSLFLQYYDFKVIRKKQTSPPFFKFKTESILVLCLKLNQTSYEPLPYFFKSECLFNLTNSSLFLELSNIQPLDRFFKQNFAYVLNSISETSFNNSVSSLVSCFSVSRLAEFWSEPSLLLHQNSRGVGLDIEEFFPLYLKNKRPRNSALKPGYILLNCCSLGPEVFFSLFEEWFQVAFFTTGFTKYLKQIMQDSSQKFTSFLPFQNSTHYLYSLSLSSYFLKVKNNRTYTQGFEGYKASWLNNLFKNSRGFCQMGNVVFESYFLDKLKKWDKQNRDVGSFHTNHRNWIPTVDHFYSQLNSGNMQKNKKENYKLVQTFKNESFKFLHFQILKILKNSGSLPKESLIPRLTTFLFASIYGLKNICTFAEFKKLDIFISEVLWRWACQRHRTKSKRWVKENYFFLFSSATWVFGFFPQKGVQVGKTLPVYYLPLPSQVMYHLIRVFFKN